MGRKRYVCGGWKKWTTVLARVMLEDVHYYQETMRGPKAATDSVFLEAVQSSVASRQKLFGMEKFVD
jgi:hypothetical protein